jgi:hypothetical protein
MFLRWRRRRWNRRVGKRVGRVGNVRRVRNV